MPHELVRALLTVLFGALAGGLTNTLAIWMLFHPYRPPRLFGRRLRILQGAIPKNQARLAAAIGRTVGDQLLTPDDLARAVGREDFRTAFDRRLAAFLDRVLHRERGSLREELPGPVAGELECLLREAADRALARLDGYLASPEFEATVERRAGELARSLADEPLGDLLLPAREEAVAAVVEAWLEEAVESPGFERAVRDYLDRAAEGLLRPGRTFEEILPVGLVASLERAIQAYLPLAIRRLGRLLEDPDARARFESAIHDLLHRFLRDLKFYQRVVAHLIVTEETVNRVLDTIEEEGAERLSELLREREVQDAMARGINDAIVDFLRRPVVSVLGDTEDDEVQGALDTVAGWVVGVARDPGTRAFLGEKVRGVLERAGGRTWGDLFQRLPPDRVARGILTVARSERARALYREAADRLVEGILDRPIGRPADWLPEDAAGRLERALGDPLWSWLQTQVPRVAERLEVARRVEEKVLAFPMERVEALIRGVTERELRLIVRLGYLLGGFIGAGLLAVNALVP